MQIRRLTGQFVLATAFVAAACLPVAAQQSPSWFVPNQGGPAAGRPAPARPSAAPTAPRPSLAPPAPFMGGGNEAQDAPPPIDVPLPPPPDLPPLDKGAPPPAALVGVLGVPDVMHASTAAQQVEKIIGERREKLNVDLQKEQAIWRDMQQALQNQHTAMNPDQVRAKERELQDRITNAQRTFRDRNNIIQQAAQYSLGQIERTLIGVIRQVAESRGMNLVLHRSQVALNVNDFDITDAVTAQLNKVLPSVQIPDDGVSLADLAKLAKPTAGAPATAATPATASATPVPPPPAPAAPTHH